MSSIITYLQQIQRTFSELPPNEVDSLIFSTLSYLNFEEAETTLEVSVPGAQASEAGVTREKHVSLTPCDTVRVKLHDIISLANWNKLIANSWMENSADDSHEFLAALQASRRYRDIECCCYKNELSPSIEKQFSAITFVYPNEVSPFNYVAYRGTDGTFTGWKEDFNLCYRDVIPSQRTALNYLSGAFTMNDFPLYVGGHSKGGNLAVFAAACCDAKTFDRVAAIFNHDGPSFLNDPSPRTQEEKFIAKYSKTVPESSIIGMILEDDDNYTVVKSTEHSVFQHNPFSWILDGLAFEKQDEINKSAKLFDEALADWIRSATDEERERYIDSIYAILASTGHERFSDFTENTPANVKTIIKNGLSVDKNTMDFIMRLSGDFARIIRDDSFNKIIEGNPLVKRFNKDKK